MLITNQVPSQGFRLFLYNVIANEYNSKDEYIIIRKQLNKYADVDNNINREHINKIYSSLVRKGISYSLIEDIISNEYNLI